MSLGVGKIKKIQKSTTVGHKREKKVQLQASDGGTSGPGKLVEEGRPKWESGVAEKFATRFHAPTHGGSCRLKNTRVSARGSLFHAEVSFDG